METLTTTNLTKQFGEFTAVNQVTLTVNQGEIFGLLGHNGAGKTTIINILAGLLTPTKGTAAIQGKDIIKEPLEARKHIGLLPDTAGIYHHLTARQNLYYFAKLAGLDDAETQKRTDELLELVRLTEWRDEKTEKYSRGMKQRLGIAQSLIRDPQILIYDEPTLGIDPEGTKTIRELVLHLAKEQGKTVLLTTHLLYEVRRICDRVGILRQGELIAVGSLEELWSQIGAGENEDLEDGFLRYQGVI